MGRTVSGTVVVAWRAMSSAAPAGLAVNEVTVAFGGLTALDGVSLTAESGEIVGVIGPNGAGKTTLFNIICGFVRPDSGTLSYRGQALGRHQPHHLAKLGIARTLQGVGLWRGLSVVENVMAGGQAIAKADFASALFGLWRSSREETRLRDKALELLGELHIAQYAKAYPQALPYGIQKRASLARALMAEPTLLLLDEPASGLSTDDMDELRELLARLRPRMGVLLVEHHMDLVMSTCDRLVVLNFGRVIATGTPAEVQANPEVTTAYLGQDISTMSATDG
ncbi:MAG TPA: ABC transporter ATP-binding protein [Acidimicrobiales bacterium]|nr:ABC transporter ATP-binding protein [Acidimicrobiales bacterium]